MKVDLDELEKQFKDMQIPNLNFIRYILPMARELRAAREVILSLQPILNNGLMQDPGDVYERVEGSIWGYFRTLRAKKIAYDEVTKDA